MKQKALCGAAFLPLKYFIKGDLDLLPPDQVRVTSGRTRLAQLVRYEVKL
jgi:hypothetical protein